MKYTSVSLENVGGRQHTYLLGTSPILEVFRKLVVASLESAAEPGKDILIFVVLMLPGLGSQESPNLIHDLCASVLR